MVQVTNAEVQRFVLVLAGSTRLLAAVLLRQPLFQQAGNDAVLDVGPLHGGVFFRFAFFRLEAAVIDQVLRRAGEYRPVVLVYQMAYVGFFRLPPASGLGVVEGHFAHVGEVLVFDDPRGGRGWRGIFRGEFRGFGLFALDFILHGCYALQPASDGLVRVLVIVFEVSLELGFVRGTRGEV